MKYEFYEGQKVLVSNHWRESVDVITKITPTGIIKCSGLAFNSDGSQRGGESFHRSYIRPLTEEDERKMKIARQISSVKKQLSKIAHPDYDLSYVNAIKFAILLREIDNSPNDKKVGEV